MTSERGFAAADYTSPWIDDEMRALGETAARFCAEEMVPHLAEWEAQQHVDRDLWHRAGKQGLLCCSIPETYGGGGGTYAHDLVVFQEQARSGQSGWGNSVHSGIVAHYILAFGTEEQKQRWLPAMASGDLVAAIAMSEPGAGSDLQSIATRAVKDAEGYRISGSKTFISNGAQADLVIVVVKTDPTAGARGISLIGVEVEKCSGFRRGRILEKIGAHSADTSELFFDDAWVPEANLLGGVEGQGFVQLMEHLPQERLVVALSAVTMAEMAVEQTIAYTRQRQVFGKPLFDKQNTRFELAECATLAHVGRVFVDSCITRHLQGDLDTSTAAMAKYWLTDIQGQVIDRCLQLHGGYGYMREYPIARMYEDARVSRIAGGSNEVMKELIARTL
ncbi:acyl-CoA dehydrogenase family protein [Nocardioides sp. LHD-245]|uniref:acyl-CoA dehydrogenase family protein n=1 Tax=Nocardioides sp. LHD-245 TaxID=3051387 RepID=UPI0027E09FD5|nr:acyl-CoA dehydrogenase family protein [Nocardioides sp. LHD-245]